MKKAITIRIPEPCHEDWNNMTPTEKGKFCDVCTKEVFDFANVTNEELVKKVYNNEKLCGRFKASQLNRELKLERKSGFSLAPLAASFLLPFTLMASTNTKPNSKNEFGSLHKHTANKLQITTLGKITDEHEKPIFNVEIVVIESGKSELSGLKGDYEIISVNDVTLLFKKDGYISQKINIKRKSETLNITLIKEVLEINNKIDEIELIEKSTDSIPETKLDTSKISLKGTITDNDNLPLPGVTVLIKGTSVSTQSDFDGNYYIEAFKNQILVFSYIGFNTKEVTLSNINNNIDLQMIEDESILGEYFITGYVITDYSQNNMEFPPTIHNPEPSPWRKKAQQSLENEKEYSRIKRVRKKETRKLNRYKK